MSDNSNNLVGSNLYNEFKKVAHADLERADANSIFWSKCPVCKKGILMVSRDQKTLMLLEKDHCILCGQQFIYTDINELRKKSESS